MANTYTNTDQLIKQFQEERKARVDQLMADYHQQQANSNLEQRRELVTLMADHVSILNAQKAKYALKQKDQNDKYATEITELKQQLEQAKQSPF